jgi:1-acyl-sn-glycerol-3-phosphate acyltransferase
VTDASPPVLRLDRAALVRAITTFLADRDDRTLDGIRRDLHRLIDEAGADGVETLNARLAAAGADWTYYPRDLLARRIHHVLAERLLAPGSGCDGIEHVTALDGQPVVIFANHLSYSDANLIEVLIDRAGGGALCDRLTVVAGPKVYSDLKRRFSSLCFGTIKVAQNSGRSSENAVMNAREVARAARQSIDTAHERLRRGDALLLFAEGSRSRSGAMQPMLAGAVRYLEGPDAWVLPVSITGTEAMFPIDDNTLYTVPVRTAIGVPIRASLLREAADGDRQLMVDAIGVAISELLPAHYRGAYADDAPAIGAARAVAAAVWAGATLPSIATASTARPGTSG